MGSTSDGNRAASSSAKTIGPPKVTIFLMVARVMRRIDRRLEL
jgi:hypothetical protein